MDQNQNIIPRKQIEASLKQQEVLWVTTINSGEHIATVIQKRTWSARKVNQNLCLHAPKGPVNMLIQFSSIQFVYIVHRQVRDTNKAIPSSEYLMGKEKQNE